MMEAWRYPKLLGGPRDGEDVPPVPPYPREVLFPPLDDGPYTTARSDVYRWERIGVADAGSIRVLVHQSLDLPALNRWLFRVITEALDATKLSTED